MIYRILDNVRVVGGHTGRIMKITPQANGIDIYTVEFDDLNLVPRTMDYTAKDIVTLLPPQRYAEYDNYDAEGNLLDIYSDVLKQYPKISCECGVASVRDGGKHSSYCPLYKSE